MNHELIIIQIRNDSSRLPFKSSLAIAGQPTLLHIINRLNKGINQKIKIIVATSTSYFDQPIADLCFSNKIECFRGDPFNVFSRYQNLIKKFRPTNVIRITGDCPLIYSPLINELIDVMNNDDTLDYASNTIRRTYPHGFDIEIFKSNIILDKKDPSELDKEHVTPFIYESGIYNTFSFESKENFSDLRITLDTFKDYLLIDKIIQTWVLESEGNNLFDILDKKTIYRIINNYSEVKKLHDFAKSKNHEI